MEHTRIFTLAQIDALAKLWQRDLGDVARNRLYNAANPHDPHPFRTTPTWASFADCINAAQFGYDCIMIQYAGMWLGIERDGYTHS